MNIIHIYSTKNWLLIKYLWPTGDWLNNQYCVFLDIGDIRYNLALCKLNKHSPAIHASVKASEQEGYAIFNIHCARAFK